MKLHLLLLTVLAATNSAHGSRVGSTRLLNACHIQDLSDSCAKDNESVEHDKLVEECDGTHGTVLY